MNRLMLDYETLDVAECPVILSMGAVVFNEHGIIDQISAKIDQESCLKIGCTISQSTLDWWDQQTPEARKMAFGGTTPIDEAMLMIISLYKKHWCSEIWSRGAIADIRWTNNILDKLGFQKPWKFWEEMCFRTFIKYSPEVKFTPIGEKHNALIDAINQANHWITINASKNNSIEIKNLYENYFTDLSVIFHKANKELCFEPSDFTPGAIEKLNEFVHDLLNTEDITIEKIICSVIDEGLTIECVTGNEKHGTYAIYKNPKAHIINITKCKCGQVHYLEDLCTNCFPENEDNYLGNGTPIRLPVFNENDLPF
ncbi:3'-5' exonuclease [Acinetobacter pittii]|uniref:3'-5' exonuclease n=1 Tax=Acinetobacter pittii TaxID=48296 RepID=UPI001EEC0491|nr:3'-5' exonuclease [Acinetobacter pittii]